MNEAIGELLLRHPDLLSNSRLLCGPSQQLSPEFIAVLREQRLPIYTWSFETQQQLSPYTDTYFGLPNNDWYQQDNTAWIVCWPKSKELALHLIQWLAASGTQAPVYAIAANDAGGKSIGTNTEPFCESIQKLDSARRCSLWQLNVTPTDGFNWLKAAKSFPFLDRSYLTLPGVFNHGKLDLGTALLLEHLPVPHSGKVLDLGCGSGVIGISMKVRQPALDITLSDIDALALRSSELNSLRLQAPATIIASNGLQQIEGKFDYIFSNPPFHSGKETDYRFAQNLFRQARKHLTHEGQLWIVANRHLPYEDWAQEAFGQAEVMVQRDGFKIILVQNI